MDRLMCYLLPGIKSGWSCVSGIVEQTAVVWRPRPSHFLQPPSAPCYLWLGIKRGWSHTEFMTYDISFRHPSRDTQTWWAIWINHHWVNQFALFTRPGVMKMSGSNWSETVRALKLSWPYPISGLSHKKLCTRVFSETLSDPACTDHILSFRTWGSSGKTPLFWQTGSTAELLPADAHRQYSGFIYRLKYHQSYLHM